MQEREITQQGGGGAAAGRLVGERGPAGRGDQPVDAAGPPAGQYPQAVPGGQVPVQVADRQAGRGPQQRPAGQRRGQVARQPRLGQLTGGVQDRVHRPAGGRVRLLPVPQPAGREPGGRAGQPDGGGHVGGGARRVRPAAGALGEDHLARAIGRALPQEGGLAAGQPRPARADDQVRAVRGEEARMPEQVLVGAERVRAEPRPGRGLGQHRPARRGGQPEQPGRVGGAVPGDDDPALGPRQVQRPRLARPGPPDPRRPVGPPVQRLGPAVAAGTGRGGGVGQPGDQRVPQRQVQVHRPGEAAVRPGRGRPGPAGQRPPVRVHPGAGFRHPRLSEPADRPAVEFQLVNGLVGAGAAQLGRPVGGQHQQGDAGLVRLDHRRVEVGCRRA